MDVLTFKFDNMPIHSNIKALTTQTWSRTPSELNSPTQQAVV